MLAWRMTVASNDGSEASVNASLDAGDPATAGFVDLPAGKLYVRSWGDDAGRPVMLLHPLGWGASSLSVAPLGTALAERGFRVLAPDLPGFGQSPRAADAADYRPLALAGRLVELLDALRVDRVTCVGVSWGATIGCWLTARHADRVAQLVAIDGGHIDPEATEGFEAGAGLQDRLRAARAHEPSWRSADKALDQLAEAYGDWTPWLDDAWRAALVERDRRWRPIVRPDVYAAAVHGLATQPASGTWAGLAAGAVPIDLVLAAGGADGAEAFATAVTGARITEVEVPRAALLGTGMTDLIVATLAAVESRP